MRPGAPALRSADGEEPVNPFIVQVIGNLIGISLGFVCSAGFYFFLEAVMEYRRTHRRGRILRLSMRPDPRKARMFRPPFDWRDEVAPMMSTEDVQRIMGRDSGYWERAIREDESPHWGSEGADQRFGSKENYL